MSAAIKRNPRTIDSLPLYASDEEIGEAVLGPDRRHEFAGMAKLQERYGMPKICTMHGGRYVPGVKAFYDAQNGLSATVPLAPDGIEGKYNAKTRRTAPRSRPEVAQAPPRGGRPVLVR
jgi:hypothetical protein